MRSIDDGNGQQIRFEDRCGFCGSVNTKVVGAPYQVRCFGCNACTPECRTLTDAVHVWNAWFALVPGGSGLRLLALASWKEEAYAQRRAHDIAATIYAVSGRI